MGHTRSEISKSPMKCIYFIGEIPEKKRIDLVDVVVWRR